MSRSLDRLLNPRSIAFIGGRECEVAIAQTRALGFTGEMYAVHPKRDTLAGVPCLRSVADLPSPPDAAFIAVKREPTIEVVRALRALGAGGAVIYASGFAETGDRHLQDALIAAADGMPLLGPNCYGFVNGLARAALWPDEHGIEACERGVAMVTQSGNIACNFTMTCRALPVAAVFAIGNQADVDMAEMLTALAADTCVTAIGLHIEGLPDVAAFAEAAQAARKPVVVLKTGRSEQGAKVAMSHTSSLAGSDALYDALLERHGIARVHSVTAFVETLKFLHHGGPLKGNRIVSMSCSGGEAALVADIALTRGVQFPPFDAETKSKVEATLNSYVAIDNPLDYHTFIWGDEAKLCATFTAVLSGGYDAAMLILDTPTHPKMRPDAWRTTARAFMHAADATGARTALVATLPECMPLDLAGDLARHGIAPMMGLDDALTAFEAAAMIGLSVGWETSRSPSSPTLRKEGDLEVSRPLTEYAAKQLLARHGLVIPKGIVCEPQDAAKAAREIGYPVTLKVSSTNIVHKTEAGGVVLNLKTDAGVAAAAARLGALSGELLVEQMIAGAVAELIVGLKSDPQFGLALVVGAGGTLTELLKDTVTFLLPTDRAEIERKLKRLKVWTLVEGFRGKSGDAAAAVAAIEAVAAFAAAHARDIEEADINPLLVLPTGAVAADAFIRFLS